MQHRPLGADVAGGHHLQWGVPALPETPDRLGGNGTVLGTPLSGPAGLQLTCSARPEKSVGADIQETCYPASSSTATCSSVFQEDGLGIEMRKIIGVAQSDVGVGLSPSRVHLPQEPTDTGRNSNGLHRGGKGQDRRRQRRQGIPPELEPDTLPVTTSALQVLL